MRQMGRWGQMLSVLLGAVLFASTALGAGMTDWAVKITEIYVHADWTMVKVSGLLNGATNNPANCTSNAYYAIEPADANYDALHATLLSAQLSGIQVRFFVDPTPGTGCAGQQDQYPHIKSVFAKTP